jgi:hypothetical protein
MGANPNRIGSPFTATKTTVSAPCPSQSAQVSGGVLCKAMEAAAGRRNASWAINGPSQAFLQLGPPHARERIRRPLVTHPRNRKDNPMNIIPEKTPSTADWPGAADQVGLIAVRVGIWNDNSYQEPLPFEGAHRYRRSASGAPTTSRPGTVRSRRSTRSFATCTA